MPIHTFFFFLTIIFVPLQIGIHFWPEWSMVLGRRVDYLSPTLFLTDISILLTLATWFWEKKSTNILKSNFLTRCSLLVTLSLLFVGLNISLAASPPVAFYKWIKVVEYSLFGLYIIRTKPSLSLVSVLLIFPILYSSILAIAQFVTQHSIGGIFWFLGERTFTIDTPGIARVQLPTSVFRLPTSELLRPYATFSHPNVLGGFLAITIPLIIRSTDYQMIGLSKKVFIILKWITVSLGVTALALTFSRSAWAIGSIGILFALFITFKKYLKHLYIGLVILIGLVGFIFFPYFKDLTPLNESVYLRQQLNTVAIDMFTKPAPLSLVPFPLYLFIGVGLGNFLVNLPLYYFSRQIFFLQPVHNIYLLIVSETGIVGLCSFLLLCIYIIRGVIRKYKKNSIVSLLVTRYSLLIPLVSILLLGLVDHYPLTLQQGQLLFTLVISLTWNSFHDITI